MAAHALQRSCSSGLFTLAAGAGIACLTSCGATEEAPKTRVASPVEQQAAPPPSEPCAEGAPSEEPSAPRSREPDEDIPGLLFPRVWSKNVPSRTCTKDDECGDGFCDRTACAPIWISGEGYGQRCGPDTKRPDCGGSRVCIDGRCRSCLAHAECPGKFGRCSRRSDPYRPNGNGCGGVMGPKVVWSPADPPPPPPQPLPVTSSTASP